MKKIAISLALALTLSATSCGLKPLVALPTEEMITDSDTKRSLRLSFGEDEKLVSALNGFSDATAEILQTSGNVNYSPISLYYALSLAKSGGADDAGLAELLGFDSADELADRLESLHKLLELTGEYSELGIANSVWSTAGIKADFAKAAAEKLRAECFESMDAGAMSSWIAEKTRGTLKPKIELVADQMLALLNTVYFKAEWIDRFNKSANEQGIFHSPSGDVEATFMKSREIKGFRRGENFTTAARSFKDNGYMQIVLPDEGVDIRELIAEQGLTGLLAAGESKSGYVNWYFPKFGFESEFSLKSLLSDLGAGGLFAENAGMAKNITDFEPMTLSEIVHGTYIEVDEKGVTASAYTNLQYAGSPMPEDEADMRMDRPFLYAIYYQNVLLFAGIVDDPLAK